MEEIIINDVIDGLVNLKNSTIAKKDEYSNKCAETIIKLIDDGVKHNSIEYNVSDNTFYFNYSKTMHPELQELDSSDGYTLKLVKELLFNKLDKRVQLISTGEQIFHGELYFTLVR